MRRIGITGLSGFIGTHLHRQLQHERPPLLLVPFESSFFNDDARLRRFVASCDVIVHLAALNRHPDPQVLYDTNVQLTEQLIGALEATGTTPYLIFSSSIQEHRATLYGASKRACRLMLAEWASRHGALFTGLIIPNTFGPLARPHYNSFIATFSDQLIRGEMPQVYEERPLGLIYIDSLCERLRALIRRPEAGISVTVPPDFSRTVSQVLETLRRFHRSYVGRGELPLIRDCNEQHLFDTFRSYCAPEFHLQTASIQR